MTLTWYGLSSFKITTTGSNYTLITDPFSKETGLTPPRGAADIVLVSRQETLYSQTESLTDEPVIIKNPGEFDLKGITIEGFRCLSGERADTIYRLRVDDIRIAFLGAIKVSELTDSQIEGLGDIDILIVPVGGGEVCKAEEAAKITQQVEPKMVVPCFYDQKGLSLKLDSAEKFIKEFGGESTEEDRLTLKPKDFTPGTVMPVVTLRPQR